MFVIICMIAFPFVLPLVFLLAVFIKWLHDEWEYRKFMKDGGS